MRPRRGPLQEKLKGTKRGRGKGTGGNRIERKVGLGAKVGQGVHNCVNSGGCRNKKDGRCVYRVGWYIKSVRINLTELWRHPFPYLGDTRFPAPAPSPDPCTPRLRKLLPHSPRPALTSGGAPAAPLAICQAAPLLRRGALPRPSSCQHPLPAGRQAQADSRPGLPPQPRQLCQARRGWGPQAVPAPREPAVPSRPPARERPALLPAPSQPRGETPSGPSSRPSGSAPPVSAAPSLGAFQSGFGSLGLRHSFVSASLSQIFAPSFLAALALGTGPALSLPAPSSPAFLRPRTPGSPARGGGQVRSGRSSPPDPGVGAALTSSCLRRRK